MLMCWWKHTIHSHIHEENNWWRKAASLGWCGYSPQHSLLHLCILRIDQQKECLIPKDLWHNPHTFPARKARCIMSSSCIFGLKHAEKNQKLNPTRLCYTAVVSERPKSRPPKCRRAAFEFKHATALSYHWLTIYLSLPTSCSVLASPSAPAWCSKSSRKFSRPHSKIAEKVAFITCGCAETCQIGLNGPWLWNLERQQISFQKPSWKNWFQPGCCCAAPMIGENNNTDVPDCPIHDCNSDIHYIAAL